MQIIAPLGWVIRGLEVLPFAGRFGATQGLKQERGESWNKDLGLVLNIFLLQHSKADPAPFFVRLFS